MLFGDKKGFTLIELLTTLGILAVLLAMVVIALNPFEQLNTARDVATKAVSQDFSTAVNAYYTYTKAFPWQKDTSCRSELATNEKLTDLPSCVKDLTDGGQLQTNVLNTTESKDMYVTECSGAIAICYNPKSSKFNHSSDAKYTKNGALNPDCPSTFWNSPDCYSCTFSTPEAQQCFEALNPHGSLAIVPSPSPNQVLPIPSRHSKNTCGDPTQGKVSCAAKVVSSSTGTPFASLALPAGFGPLQLHTAYNLPCTPGGIVSANCSSPVSFGPQTIGIVDAYSAPTIENDLAMYDTTYGLPPCTKANGCLTVVNQNGATSPLPSIDSGWALETSLDVEMAHAVCQTCKILLVEANSNAFDDMGAGENRTAAMGATAISNSYGIPEYFWFSSNSSYYNHPGIFITASSGDWGPEVFYPAGSNNVIAVGGTTLSLFADNTYASESGWVDSGLGCAEWDTPNSFQKNLSNWFLTGCNNERGVVDVSADADPNTGVSVYDSTAYGGQSGWWILGGTSVSSPVVAAALSLIGSAPSTGPAAALLYANPNKFRDITSNAGSSCGTSICIAGLGYDGPTGLGSPNFGQASLVSSTPIPTPTPTPTLPEYPPPWKEAANFEGGKVSNLDPTNLIEQYMVAPYNAKMNYSNNFTVEAWIKPDVPNFTSSSSYTYTIVNNSANLSMDIKPNGTNISYEYSFTVNVKTSINCEFTGIYSSNGDPWYDVRYWKTVSPSEFNTWKHIAGVYKNGTFSIYENGIKLNAGYEGGTICNDGSNFMVGANDGHSFIQLTPATQPANGFNPNMSEFFNGDIEDVRISNSARYTTNTFTPPTIPFSPDANTMMLYHFDNNTQDSSGNGLDGILWGGATYVQSIPPSGVSTPTPTPTPTQASSSCSFLPVVTLSPTTTQTATVGTTTKLPYTLTVTSTDSAGCSSTYTTYMGLPSGWAVVWDENGTLVSYPPPTITLAGGQTMSIPFTVWVPPYAGTGVGDYMYQIWVLKAGQTYTNPVYGYVQVDSSNSSPTSTPTPTPIPTPTPAPTLTPTPTPTPTPTSSLTATPTPTPTQPPSYPIGPYKLDYTKFLQTYAVLAFPNQSFPPNWDIDVSFRPDFGGTVTTASIGYYVNGVPATADSDTILNVAYAGDGNFGTSTSTSYADQIKLTAKHFAFISMPYEWKQYANGCGKTIYWRVVGWPGDGSGLIGPTYSGTVDCATKVGVQTDMSTWGTLPEDDFNNDGVYDYTDYIIGALWTKFRSGGWQPPE